MANNTYTVSMILDGALPANGDLTAYLNGQLIGSYDNVGYLYNHTGSIGIEQKSGGTVIHGIASPGTGMAFDGTLDILVQYNEAIPLSLRSQVDAYLAGIKSSPIIDPSSTTTSVILSGTVGDDNLSGSAADEIAYGGDGNDTINTFDGNDAIYGGQGNDTINGGNGNDILYGQDGDDFLRSDTGNNQFYGGTGADTIRGGINDDLAFGGDGNDDIRTGAGNDIIYGDAGDDYIDGGDGADLIHGGDGNDTIRGGTGNDIIIGGAGSDKLYGDGGNDIYGFSADENTFDTFYGFNMLQDKINITDLLTGFSGDDISQFAQLVHVGSRFDLQVDRDGAANGQNFQTVARVLTNIDDSITAQDLFDDGVIIANQSLLI